MALNSPKKRKAELQAKIDEAEKVLAE